MDREISNYQMLEIKNVTKVYKTKGGVDTRALDNVSISFANTGLVFLLGKSGSGKSTLLNVSGGLDEPTAGEIIVKGKSSKNFTGSDFDSYRNTFVGFIFQEYNILDEFNVEDNIALALELQGKPKDKEKINSILRDVELEAFAKRKPNTLSGGQKQRIAIARALVKEPQIIMADEPTGALDSNTGKQVFDTLKKLSETRLVIVVSHDREFAEIYGDRIVELADGKIISDVTKTRVPAETLDENVSVIGGNTLSIKSGAKLTEKNIKTIRDFIANTQSDVIITNGKKEISSFKKINRMSESGATEKFEDTPENAIVHKEYTAEESKFIRSRLPAAKAVKIGASSLKLKPVRLIFTIFLSVISFIMFGLLSTLMMYDGHTVLVNSFVNSDYDYLCAKKGYLMHYEYPNYSYTNTFPLNFSDDDLKYFKTNFGADSFGYYEYNTSVSNVEVDSRYEYYYTTAVLKFVSLPAAHSLKNDITGAYPSNDGEICISSYLYEVIKENSYYGVNVSDKGTPSLNAEPTEIKSEKDIIGKYITLGIDKGRAFKVTGVFKSGNIPSKYNDLKEHKTVGALTRYEYQALLNEGLKCALFVTDSFIEKYNDNFGSQGSTNYVQLFDYCNSYIGIYGEYGSFKNVDGEYVWETENDDWEIMGMNSVLAYEKSDKLNKYFLGNNNKTKLSDDELILNIGDVKRILERNIVEYYMSVSQSTDGYDRFNEASGKYNEFYGYINKFELSESREDVWVDDGNGGHYETVVKQLTPQERMEALDKAVEVLKLIDPVEITVKIDGSMNAKKFKLAGVYAFCDFNSYLSNNGIIFSQKFINNNLSVYSESRNEYTNYVPETGLKYNGVMVPYDKSASSIQRILGIMGEENAKSNDVVFSLDSLLYSSVEMVNELVEMMSVAFLWIGIVLAVFSALLLFNFISVSISNKKKEIGILRAVGARGIDVFKIFFAESGIIVGICAVVAIIGSLIACSLINNIMKAKAGLAVTLFVFGPASIGMLLGIAIVVAVISTFLPVYLASRKKPVESIRAL